jgi:hypothetical protein
MAANGISTLATKELRQKAKLDLASLKRQGYTLNADGTVADEVADTLTTSSAQSYSDGVSMATFRVLNRGGNWDEFFANWDNGTWSCVQFPGSVVTNMTNPGDDSPIITITGGTFVTGTFYSFTGDVLTAGTADTNAPFYRARATYDITQLPTQYDDNAVVNNPNTGGLVEGRPWVTTVSDFTFYETYSNTSAVETTQYVSGNKIYAYSSSFDVVGYQPPRVVVNDVDVLTVDTADNHARGHNVVVLDSYGNVTATYWYDTYIDPANSTAMATMLGAVPTGYIVVLVVYDASALSAGVRSVLNSNYGSTNNYTWSAFRNDYIFIGIRNNVAATPSLRSFLSGAGQTAYDAASADSFFAVSSTDWDAVVAGVASTSKVGPDDTQFASGPGNAFSSGYIITYPSANATVPANNYIIGFRATTVYTNQQYRIYGGPTFKSTSPVYSQISTTSPSTGGTTGTYYYLRKAPTVQAATTYIGIYGTQNLTMTVNATGFWAGGGYTSGAFTTWSNHTLNMPKVQVLITPTTVT